MNIFSLVPEPLQPSSQICLRDVGELMEVVMEGTYHSVLTQDKYNQDMREDDRFDVSSTAHHIYVGKSDVIAWPNVVASI